MGRCDSLTLRDQRLAGSAEVKDAYYIPVLKRSSRGLLTPY